MKIAVCSCIIGAYDDKLYEPEYIDNKKYEFILFTNNSRLSSNVWNIRYDKNLIVPNNISKSAYYYKWNLHKLLDVSKYDCVVWVDSSLKKFNYDKFDKFVDEFIKSNNSLWIEKHPSNNTLQSELDLNVRLTKDNINNMITQVKRYYSEGYVDKFDSCVETGFSLRKLSDSNLVHLCDIIWTEMLNDTATKRDQLIYDYALWKSKFSNYKLFTFEQKSKILQFQDHPHKPEHNEKVLLVGPYLGDEKYEKQWVEYVKKYLSNRPVDSVIVGCRTERQKLYDSIKPDKFIISDPQGDICGNLIDGNVPTFNIKCASNKNVIQLNVSNDIFNRFKLYDSSVHFKVHIVGRKPGKYIDKCLRSLIGQTHQKWTAQVILDPSDDDCDDSYIIAKKYESDKIKIKYNSLRHGVIKNHIESVSLMNPTDEDVCVCLDADDWFAHDYVLQCIENVYNKNPIVLLTYGSWTDYPNPGSIPNNSITYTENEFKNIRRVLYKATHVRTVKYKLWKLIKDNDLKHTETNEYYDSCGDVAIMLPLLEMAGYDRVAFIPDILYIYNRETNYNEDKVSTTQIYNYRDIVNKSPYLLYTEDGIDIIIFSKDRAMQLDAFLRSLQKYHKDLDKCSINILYTYSNDNFKRGYDLIKTKYPDFNFVYEQNFNNDLNTIFESGKYDYVQFFVDDNIWKNEFKLSDREFIEFKNNTSLLALSLRLYPKINYCYPMKLHIDNIPESIDNNFYIWEWNGKLGDWGYPMSVDGNIFRKSDIGNYIKYSQYDNPNTFESTMALHPLYNTKMICYEFSKILNCPINRVQTTYNNICGNVDVEYLNENFLNGKIINIENFDNILNNSCHQEYEIELEDCGI